MHDYLDVEYQGISSRFSVWYCLQFPRGVVHLVYNYLFTRKNPESSLGPQNCLPTLVHFLTRMNHHTNVQNIVG